MIEAYIKIDRDDVENLSDSYYDIDDFFPHGFDIWCIKTFTDIVELREYLVDDVFVGTNRITNSTFHQCANGREYMNRFYWQITVNKIIRYETKDCSFDQQSFIESVQKNIATEFDKRRRLYFEEVEKKKKINEEKKALRQSEKEVEKRRKQYENLKKEFG